MTDTSKKLLKLSFRILGTTALLIWVISKIDLSQLGPVIQMAKWRYFFISLGLTLTGFWLRSMKMRLILKKQHCYLNTAKIFAASAVTVLYNFIMPGFISSGIKWYIIRSHTGKGHKVLSSMIYNQATDIVTIFTLGLIALMITNPGNHPNLPAVCAILIIAAVISSILLLSQTFGARVTKFLQYALKPFPAIIQKKGGEVIEQISLFQKVRWLFHFKMLGYNIIRIAVRSCAYFFAAKAANINVGFVTAVWLFVLVFLLGRLPISVGNLGVREATLVQALAIYGVDASNALLMSMVIFSALILMAVIGAMYQLFWTAGAKKTAQPSGESAA